MISMYSTSDTLDSSIIPVVERRCALFHFGRHQEKMRDGNLLHAAGLPGKTSCLVVQILAKLGLIERLAK
jgi:hypothetical protein